VPDSNPFLFVHMPLDRILSGALIDSSPHRHTAFLHGDAKIVSDETFGSCLDLPSAPGSYVEFSPWKLNAMVLLPARPGHSPAEEAKKFTFSIWLLPAAGEAEWTVIDAGIRPELRRLTVRFKRTGETVSAIVQGPSELNPMPGFRWTSEAKAAAGQWLHFAFVWDPAGYGECRMFLNGGFFSSSAKTNGDALQVSPDSPSPSTFLGRPSYFGRLAHFRIYTRELTPDEIALDMDKDLGRLRIAGPVDCSLLDPRDRPMMFLDASGLGEKMQLVVKPARGAVTLGNLPRGPVAPDRCHFELAFRPGALDVTGNGDIKAGGAAGAWEAKSFPRTSPDGHDSVCIRCTSEVPIPAEGIKIVLTTLKADSRFGPRWTLMEIRYRNLKDAQGNFLNGRVSQWLQLFPRNLVTRLSMRPLAKVAGWIPESPNSGASLRVDSDIHLEGHLYCASIQDQMRKDAWQVVTNLPPRFAPFGGKEILFPARVRWRAAAGPPALESLWWSDLIVGANGAVSLDADLPPEVLAAAGRVDVYLDDLSYPDEKLWMVG
jgi:hypothetical protein